MNEKPQQIAASWVVYVTLALVVFFGVVFVVTFIVASQGGPAEDAAGTTALSAQTYMEEVEILLANANTARGETLVTRDYECYACHIQGSDKIAPSYTGLKDRAGEERPPLTAAAYIYEAIVFPGIHIVEGYPDAMPKNYMTRLSQRDLGDILAYLLTQ